MMKEAATAQNDMWC